MSFNSILHFPFSSSLDGAPGYQAVPMFRVRQSLCNQQQSECSLAPTSWIRLYRQVSTAVSVCRSSTSSRNRLLSDNYHDNHCQQHCHRVLCSNSSTCKSIFGLGISFKSSWYLQTPSRRCFYSFFLHISEKEIAHLIMVRESRKLTCRSFFSL